MPDRLNISALQVEISSKENTLRGSSLEDDSVGHSEPPLDTTAGGSHYYTLEHWEDEELDDDRGPNIESTPFA